MFTGVGEQICDIFVSGVFSVPTNISMAVGSYSGNIGANMFTWMVGIIGLFMTIGGLIGLFVEYTGMTGIVGKMLGVIGLGDDDGGRGGFGGGGSENFLEGIIEGGVKSFITGIILLLVPGALGYVMNMAIRIFFIFGASVLGASCTS